MKKILIMVLGVFLITGCNQNIELDLETIETKLDNLTTDTLSIQSVDYMKTEAFEEMTNIYDYEFGDIFGLDNTLVESYNVLYNADTKQLLAIFKPTDNNKDALETSFSNFTDTLDNVLHTEYEGYVIYISSNDNDKVLEEIQNTKEPLFPAMSKVEKESLELTLGIKEEEVEEVLFKMPMMMTNSATYIIIKPTEGNKEIVEEKVNTYMENLEQNWSTYLPDQYELVKDRTEEEIGEYLVYIISNDNEKVLEAIKN